MREECLEAIVANALVFLRRVSKKDLDIYFHWYRDPEVQRFLPNPSWNPWLSEADYRGIFLRRHLLQTGTSITLTICLAEDKSPVGLVDLYEIDRKRGCCEFGVVVGEKRLWRKGIATAAVKLAMAYAFGSIGLSAVYCNILPENIPSIHLFERCGFTYQGTACVSETELLRYRLMRPVSSGETSIE